MAVDHLSEFPRDTTTQTAVVKIHQLASDCITENIVGRPIVGNSDIVCVIKRTVLYYLIISTSNYRWRF